ncbi:MAG: family 43 glycosylhydrolase [Chloroflexi bacterium]|nr:family 43 glycosylhydrolase [Chloroflexota bacterium]
MRHIFAGLFVIALLVVATSGLAQGPEGEVQIDAENAAVWHGEDWDNRYTDPGAVLYHDGQFHMFRNGFLAWPAEVQIAYTVSDDGITWEKVGADPVLRTDEIPYAGTAALASSALVEDDGTWVLYFYTWPPLNSDVVGGIGRATAPAPEGPWTPDEALVLTPGAESDWDSGLITAASVVKYDGTYYMYYDHLKQGQPTSIGMATSEDGITWTKYDNPETTDAPFANSDPVLTPAESEDAWDREHVLQPSVAITEDGWVMMYKSFTGAQQDQSLGFATSEDAIVWERATEEPVFTNSDIRQRRMWFTRMVHHDGVYYLYLELQRNYQGQTDIYAGTLDIDLFGE